MIGQAVGLDGDVGLVVLVREVADVVVIRRCVVVVDAAHIIVVALECLRPEGRSLLFFAQFLAGSIVFAAVVSARTVVLLSLSVVVLGLRVGTPLSQVTAFSFTAFIVW